MSMIPRLLISLFSRPLYDLDSPDTRGYERSEYQIGVGRTLAMGDSRFRVIAPCTGDVYSSCRLTDVEFREINNAPEG